MTPAERYAGEGIAILARRKRVYEQARQENPSRWSGNTRNWEPVAEVTLNPLKTEEDRGRQRKTTKTKKCDDT
jgi:hypothetical protein